jgi:hypothetical protein
MERLGARQLLRRKGLAKIGVLRDGLKRCQQRSLLVRRPEGLLVIEVVKVSVVAKVDDALRLEAQVTEGFP